MSRYRIAEFELDLRAGELRRAGERVLLQDLPLRLLGQLAARAGEVVTRDDLHRSLWPENSFLAFEDGLNTAMRKLRQALEDDPREPRFIETVRGYGYRLLVPVEMLEVPVANVGAGPSAAAPRAPLTHAPAWGPGDPDASACVAPEEPEKAPTAEMAAPAPRKRNAWAAYAAACLLPAAAVAWWLAPLAPPAVQRVLPVTTSGRLDLWTRPTVEGGRLYYAERQGDHWELMQTSAMGSEDAPLDTGESNTVVFDVSDDARNLLEGTFPYRGSEMTLWSRPAQGGPRIRIGNLVVASASWSHDGRWIAYGTGTELWKAAADGSNPQRLLVLANPNDAVWSPDDQVLRFHVGDPIKHTDKLWEVRPDGSGLRPFDTGWSGISNERMGGWSPDGQFFYFASDHGGQWNLWAVRERGPGWRRAPRGPFQLTSGPVPAGLAMLPNDGRRIYFYGERAAYELNAYDPAARTMVPFLPAVNPEEPAFSRDGRWMTFMNLDHQLWRSRADGSDRVRLMPTTMTIWFPHWSPDGKMVAFTGQRPGESAYAYLVPRDGGVPEPLTKRWLDIREPDWAADGKRLAVSYLADAKKPNGDSNLGLVSWPSRTTETIPDSRGWGAPRWSPDGAWIAATANDGHRVRVYNVQSHTWVNVAQGGTDFGIAVWSFAGDWLYFQDLQAAGEPLYRWRPGGGVPEKVADFTAALAAGAHRCALIGAEPGGKILMSLTRSTSDLYVAELAAN